MWDLNLASWPQTLLNPSDNLMSWWVALVGCGAKGSVQDPQQLPGSLYQHIAVCCLLPPPIKVRPTYLCLGFGQTFVCPWTCPLELPAILCRFHKDDCKE